MRIAVLGAPGAGKTKLLENTLEILPEHRRVYQAPHIQSLEETGRRLGLGATYIENLWLAFLQEKEIEEWEFKAKGVIVEGTLLQRYAHMSIEYDDRPSMLGSDKVSRMQAGLEILALLTLDLYRFDMMFLLESPLAESLEFTYEEKVEKHLRDILEQLKMPYTYLAGTDEEKARDFVEAIERKGKSNPDHRREDPQGTQ